MVRPLGCSGRKAADAVAGKQHVNHRADNHAAATLSEVTVPFNEILAGQRAKNQRFRYIKVDRRPDG